MARQEAERAHTRELLRIRLGGMALILLCAGLVALSFYLAVNGQYTTAAAVLGGSVGLTAIGRLEDRLMGGGEH